MRKEIVAKTIQKRLNKEYSTEIVLDIPVTRVLGCWLINQKINVEHEDRLVVSGSFDLHSWVGFEKNTNSKVISKKEEFSFNLPDIGPEGIVVVSYTKPPYCDSYEISENKVKYLVRFTYCVEWICDTKLYVEVADDELDQVIDLQVNEDYIENE